MCAKAVSADPHNRQRIAQLSARLMVQEGINDYQYAKQKAASQLGMDWNSRNLPSNSEIEEEIQIYQRLFYADSQPQRLLEQRNTALQAMQMFADFHPRLVGSVLSGTATDNAEITLHLFADTAEDVAFLLMNQGIPYTTIEKRYRNKTAQQVTYPGYRFVAGDEPIVLIVFDLKDRRWSPPSPVDGKPMQRANLRDVQQLLEEA